MEDENINIIGLVIDKLIAEGLWFTTKSDPTYGEPSSYYKLNQYGEPEDNTIKKIEKEVTSLIGDGAIDVDDAVELWKNDALSGFKVDYTDNLVTQFEDKPVVDNIEAYENPVQFPQSKKTEGKQLAYVSELQKDTLLKVDEMCNKGMSFTDVWYELQKEGYDLKCYSRNHKRGSDMPTRGMLYKDGEFSLVTIINGRNGKCSWETEGPTYYTEAKTKKIEYYKMPDDEHIIWDSEIDYYDDDYMDEIKETIYSDYVDDFEPKEPLSYEDWLNSSECYESHYHWFEDSGIDEGDWDGLVDLYDDYFKEDYDEYVANYEDKPLDFDTWYRDYISNNSYDDWELLEEDLKENIFPAIDSQVNEDILLLRGNYGSNYPDFVPSGAGGKLFGGTEGFRDYMSGFDRVCITTQNGILGAICNDHDGTVSGSFYTIPDDIIAVAKALGFEETVRKDYEIGSEDSNYTEEDIDDLIEQDFNEAIYYDGLDARDFDKIADMLIPIKDTISGYGQQVESKKIKTEAEEKLYLDGDMADKLEKATELDFSNADIDILKLMYKRLDDLVVNIYDNKNADDLESKIKNILAKADVSINKLPIVTTLNEAFNLAQVVRRLVGLKLEETFGYDFYYESKKVEAKFKDKVKAIKKSLKRNDKRLSDKTAEKSAEKIAGSMIKKEAKVELSPEQKKLKIYNICGMVDKARYPFQLNAVIHTLGYIDPELSSKLREEFNSQKVSNDNIDTIKSQIANTILENTGVDILSPKPALAVTEARTSNKRVSVKKLRDELTTALKSYMINPEVGFDEKDVGPDKYGFNAYWEQYCDLNIGTDNDGDYIINVSAELDYDGMMELADKLNEIVKKYDNEAYFDNEDTGRLICRISKNKVKNMTETKKVNFNRCTKEKVKENYQRRLDEVNNKSANTISAMITDRNFDSDSDAGKIILRTQELFNVLSDKGYDVNVKFDNGESTSEIQLGTLGGKVVITITNTDQPLRAFLSGNFEITDDNIKVFDDIKEQITAL